MNYCIVSSAAPDAVLRALETFFGRERILALPPDDEIDLPVSCHPDMILCLIAGRAVIPRRYAAGHPEIVSALASAGYPAVLSDAPREKKYPSDVSLNAAVGEDFIICRAKSTAPELLALVCESGMKLIDVKQGYAGCSCVVCANCVLSSDEGICSAARNAGLESFYAPKNGIVLPGYDCGFIGGCSGIHDGTLYLTGKPTGECADAVNAFVNVCGLSLCLLTEGALYDCGGIKFV